MRLAILGAGAIAFASAALAATRGHTVTLWSPSGRGTDGLRAARLEATGAVEGAFDVAVATSAAEAIAGADAMLIAVPANGHLAVIEAVAPYLAEGCDVLVNAAASLSPLVLDAALAARGVNSSIGAMGTTAVTARRVGAAGVNVLALRGALDLAAIPHASLPRLMAIARDLFGDRFIACDSALGASLANLNPVMHTAMALCNLSRIERAEAWPQYQCTTPSVARLIEVLDTERLALARAYGIDLVDATASFRRSYALAAPDLAGMMAELHARRGGPNGPTTIESRYVLEDVPYGLVFYLALARAVGLAMPVTEGAVSVVSAAWGRDFTSVNQLLRGLDLGPARLAAVLSAGNPRAP